MANIRKMATCWMLLLLVLCMCGMLIWIGNTANITAHRLTIQAMDSMNDGWSVETEAGLATLEDIRTVAGDSEQMLVRRLPDDLMGKEAILIYHQTMRFSVYLNGRLLGKYGVEELDAFGSMAGMAWEVVELPKEAAGGELRLSVTPSRGGLFFNICLGREDNLYANLLLNNLPRLFGCLLMILLGGVQLVLGLLCKLRGTNGEAGNTALGIFVINAAVWTFSDSQLMQLLTNNQLVCFYFSVFTFTLLPATFLLFVRSLLTQYRTLLNRCCVGLCAMMLALLWLLAANLLDFIVMLLLVHILIIACVTLIVVLCVRERKSRTARALLMALLALMIFCVAAFVLFYSTKRLEANRSDYALTFMLGLLIFCAVLSGQRIRANLQNARQAALAEYFQRQAYIDALTGLSNFAACEQSLERLEADAGVLSVMMLDLNNLKNINDSYGHAQGDALLQRTAECLRRAFDEVGECFRRGGDEFLVLLPGIGVAEVERQERRFYGIVAECNLEHKLPVDVSCGSATRAAHSGEGIRELVSRADRKMYIHKAKRKQKIAIIAEL